MGCASVKPIAVLGVGYQLDSKTDHWLQTTRDYECSSNFPSHIKLGVETKNKWQISYYHQSWVPCGGPFNSKPETYKDQILIEKKFGGFN